MKFVGVAGLYVASIIGAGFASGQEVVVFFVKYGWGGAVGIALAIMLLGVGVALVLDTCQKRKASSYKELFAALGPRTALMFDGVYSLFLLVGASVMLAGSGAMVDQGISQALMQIGTAFLVFLVLQRGVHTVLKISGPLAMVMIGVLGLAALNGLSKESFVFSSGGSWRGFEAAILYASYNLGFALAVLAGTHDVLVNTGERWAVVVIGSLVLGILLSLLFFALNGLTPEQLLDAFPAEHLAARLGSQFLLLYKIILWIAMYTTALANSLALVKRITDSGDYSWLTVTAGVFLISAMFSFVGFKNLVQWVYPLLGVAGLWILFVLVRDYLGQKA